MTLKIICSFLKPNKGEMLSSLPLLVMGTSHLTLQTTTSEYNDSVFEQTACILYHSGKTPHCEIHCCWDRTDAVVPCL